VAPWWWFPFKPKHVGAASLILNCFNNSTFLTLCALVGQQRVWQDIKFVMLLRPLKPLSVLCKLCPTLKRSCYGALLTNCRTALKRPVQKNIKCFVFIFRNWTIPVAAWSEARVCVRAVLLGLRVQIPSGWRMPVCCECCALSSMGLCDGPITCTEEFSRVWCVWGWSRNLKMRST